MLKPVLTISCCIFCLLLHGQNADLPGPTPNLQTLPSGSYVIAMDNTLQVNSSGNFNLKAYGLVVYLLNNNVRVRWSIKAGKAKDGIDFTASAEQIKPTFVSGGVSRNFKAGPFVIFAPDTTGVSSLIDAFYATSSLTGLNRPQVYRLTADASNVDIRYDLAAFRPKAAILTDGGNQNIHLAYMTAASIPAQSYATSQGTDLLTNCFTFASEPHNSKTGTAVNNAISAIKDFVSKGGNFLAQCEAINNYENNTLGRFQTTGGITISNAGIGTAVTYANPDLSYSQFEGNFNASYGGSLKNWQITGVATNNAHNHATGTGSNSNVIGASASKHYYDKGGMVFYLGSHSFTTSSLDGINGIRMYMNAFLTPSNTNCPVLLFTPLDLRLLQFSGNNVNNQTVLQWIVCNNELVQQLSIEKSTTGTDFTTSATITPSSKPGLQSYRYSQSQSAEKTYYRIKVAGRQGNVQYSSVLAISAKLENTPSLKALNAPGRDDVSIAYHSNKNDVITLNVYNSSGLVVFTEKLGIVEGTNILSVPPHIVSAKGFYFIETINEGKIYLRVKVVRF